MNKQYDSSQYISELEAENEELKKILNSKRYKIVNKLTDAAYKIVRKGKKTLSETKINYTVQPHKERDIESKRIDIINVNFYDWDGNVVYKGGAERYVYDLACMLKTMGYKPRLIQGANESFEKEYRGIKVVGIKMPSKDMNTMSRIYNDFCINAELVIASPLELASRIDNGAPIIAINHGVNFDHELNVWKNTANLPFWEHFNALKNVRRCVCVDTNFINWVRTRDYKMSAKLDFIPNYYDAETMAKVTHTEHKEVNFVYPRRIYSARGYDITLQAFEPIIRDFPDTVRLYFVGQYDTKEIEQEVEAKIKQYPKNIFHAEYTMNKMYQAYNDADVVLVPTRYSEGTSLSCIEGMASGAAVITTTVGGLPNLVIDNYNGLVVNPTDKDIEIAARKLIADKQLRKKLAKNGKNVAEASFKKDLWDMRWQKILNDVLE